MSDPRRAVMTAGEQAPVPLNELIVEFIDPADAFVFSPRPVTLRDLALGYAERWGREDVDTVLRELRTRARTEGWDQRREIELLARTRGRTALIIKGETEKLAALAVDMAGTYIHGLLHRYKQLMSIVHRELDLIEEGAAQYSKAVSAMMIELRALEERVCEILPDVGLKLGAQRSLSATDGATREAIVQRCNDRFETMRAAAQGSTVIDIVDRLDAENRQPDVVQ